MTVYKKTRGPQKGLLNFFRCCARAPAAAEWGMHSPQGEYNPPFGECRRQNPPRQREGNPECNEVQSRRRRECQRPQSHPSPRQRHTQSSPHTTPAHLHRAIHKETLRMAHNTLSTTDNRAHIAFHCLGAGLGPGPDPALAPTPAPDPGTRPQIQH